MGQQVVFLSTERDWRWGGDTDRVRRFWKGQTGYAILAGCWCEQVGTKCLCRPMPGHQTHVVRGMHICQSY